MDASLRDPTATAGVAIEHRSDDPHEDRFPLAIFQPITAENVDFTARVKIISGTLLAAGIALGVRNPNSYYAIALSALEHRVDVLLVLNGKVERLESAEAEIARDRWHELRVLVNDDHFTVTVDGAKLITTYDRSPPQGRPRRAVDAGGQRHALRSHRHSGSPRHGVPVMPYRMKPLPCAPARIKRMSKRLILSHYENNYGGAVTRKLHERHSLARSRRRFEGGVDGG